MGAKRACLVYVTATASKRDAVRGHLEECGYSICEVKADLEDAIAAQAGEDALPDALKICIESSDVSVFLLPEDPAFDGLMGPAAGAADSCDKPVIGVVEGVRGIYPEEFQDTAHSMIREGSTTLPAALAGEEIWEKADRTRIVERPFKTVRCQ